MFPRHLNLKGTFQFKNIKVKVFLSPCRPLLGMAGFATRPLLGMAGFAEKDQRTAALLGYSGLIPFTGLAALALYAPEMVHSLGEVESIYGTAILSFLGGIQWGTAISATGPEDAAMTSRLLGSVTPSILGFLSMALIQDIPIRLACQAGLFIGVYLYDRFSIQRGWLPSWFLDLRRVLTGIVSGSLLLTAFIALRNPPLSENTI
jgi:hypothetical protein